MEGFSQDKESAGDFGTPEQTIPATGLPGLDWETCMTMNDNWGYNSHDKNFKSAQSLLRMLADVASKGGNYLLNVGPTAEGVFPPESVERLKAIGAWTAANGESIYATQASPFKALPWGRCTRKAIAGGARLYLHVFDWPADGKLIVPGLSNKPRRRSSWPIPGKPRSRWPARRIRLSSPSRPPAPTRTTPSSSWMSPAPWTWSSSRFPTRP